MRCFSSVRSLLFAYEFSSRYPGCPGWVSPFGNLRVRWLCAPNRSLSQLITSFIADGCQGIPHVPLSASNCKSYRIHSFASSWSSVRNSSRTAEGCSPAPNTRTGVRVYDPAFSSLLAQTAPCRVVSHLSRCLIDSLLF